MAKKLAKFELLIESPEEILEGEGFTPLEALQHVQPFLGSRTVVGIRRKRRKAPKWRSVNVTQFFLEA